MLKRITRIRERITRVRLLVLANLVAVAVGLVLAVRYFGWGRSTSLIEWGRSTSLQDWLGVTVQGSDDRWFYFGSILLVLGPVVIFPLYVQRYFQKRQCQECGRRHIQYF